MYNAVIVDDDPLAHEILKDQIEEHSDGYMVNAQFYSVREAILKLPKTDVDLVFLDMELKDGKGFDVLEELEDFSFEVVITTSHDSFMLEAIKHAAVDYLIKPVNKSDLAEALARFEKRLALMGNRKEKDGGVIPDIRKLALPMQEGLVLVNVADIIRLESDGSYTKFVLTDGSVHVVSKNLGIYEAQLAPHGFFRVHHGHLINLEQIRTYVKGEGGQVVMMDGSSVDVSRRKKEDFLNALGA